MNPEPSELSITFKNRDELLAALCAKVFGGSPTYSDDAVKAPQPLEIKLDLRYVRRDGNITGKLVAYSNPGYPFWDPLHAKSYASTGEWDIGVPSKYDLICEVSPLS